LNRTKPKTGSNRLISVQFGFFPFQTGSNPMVLSTSPAISYNRSQVAGVEDPFGLPRLNPCLQLHPTLQIRQKTQDPNISPRKHNHRNQSRLSYFKKKHKGSNTLVFSVLQGRSFLLKSSSRVEWVIWWVNSAKYSSSSLFVSVEPTMTNLFCFDFSPAREGRGGGRPTSQRVKWERCREGRAGGRVKWEWNERDAEGAAADGLMPYSRVRKDCIYTCLFFWSADWLNRFGSVQSVSDFRNRNWTEPEFFCDFLIG